LDVITGNEAFALLDHILEEVNFTPEDIEGHIAAFSKFGASQRESLIENHEPQREVKSSISKRAGECPTAEEGKRKEFRIKDSLTINSKIHVPPRFCSLEILKFSQKRLTALINLEA